MAWLDNTCAVRMSLAFHHAGDPIPARYSGLVTTFGRNGKRYAFRVEEFARWLDREYRPRAIRNSDLRHFSGKQGIMMLDLRRIRGNTWHLDMWNGRRFKYNNELYGMEQVPHWAQLWPCPA